MDMTRPAVSPCLCQPCVLMKSVRLWYDASAMTEIYKARVSQGEKIRFSYKHRPEEWTPAVVREEVPMEDYPDERFYRVTTAFRLSKPQTVLIGTRRCRIEKV